MRKYAIPASGLVIVLIAIALAMALMDRSPSVSGQDTGITPLVWPPFIMVYETTGGPISNNGVPYEIRETKRLDWKSRNEWRTTVISTTPITFPDGEVYDTTGSYQEVKDSVYTRYDARIDSEYTVTLGENQYFAPDGLFSDILYEQLNLAARTDGDLVILDAYICDGMDCDEEEGVTGQTSHTAEGVLFDEWDIIFTGDENRIPMEVGDVQVSRLHTNPPTPPVCIQHFPDMNVTNPTLQLKREPFTHAMQSWDPRCMSSHAPTHNAQFYTFVNHDVTHTDDKPVFNTMRVNIKMTTRHDDAQLLLLGATLLDGLEPDAPIVATAEPVEAEAGALRTLEIEKVVPYGAYTIEVRARNPGDAVFDLTAAHVYDPPAFEQDSYTFSVAEDAGRFTTVGTVAAVDEGGRAVTYRITSGADGKFSITHNRGMIVVNGGLDYESRNTYTLTVEARNPDGRTGTATVTINVTSPAGT